MGKLTFAVLGCGNRGTQYTSKILEHDDAEVTAVCDVRPERLTFINQYLHLPEDKLFSSAEDFLKAPKLADVLIIATQDATHKQYAIPALEKGYDLILEKPLAVTMGDCEEISEAVRKYNRKALVCHVLRYTPFYREIKNQIKKGAIGKVESIQAQEGVGYYHIAHSYVRGNWHKEADSSPMILAKCCHDMDLMLWLTDAHCEKVSSFGSLDYFKKENAPEGSADRCLDCKLDCPYNAVNFYLERMPGWPSNVVVTEPTKENLLEALKTSNYGKCVFKMDNDVVDHQVVNLLLSGGTTVNFSMCGFTAIADRTIDIMGTEGEIVGNMRSNEVHVCCFHKPEEVIDVSKNGAALHGHGGGDEGLINDAIRYFRGDTFDRTSITEITASVESHRVAFAAEEARVKGTIINL